MHAVLLAAFLFAQQPDVVAQRIEEATLLVDAGRFDEAIAALKTIAAENPDNRIARYELALAYAAKGDNAHCRETVEPLTSGGFGQVDALVVLGNCLEALGEHAKAMETFRKGLKIAPTDFQLMYNLAVVLVKEGKLDAARQLLETDTRANPLDAAAHSLLAKIFEAQGYRVPAIFSYLHFLAIDSSPRAAEAATRLHQLLNAGVERDGKETKITIAPSSRDDEGEYLAMDLLLAAASASRGEEEETTLSEFEQTRLQVAKVIDLFVVLQQKGTQRDYTAAVQRPFFETIKKEKLLDTLAARATMPLGMAGQEEWTKAHAADLARYSEWLEPQLGRPLVHLQ